MIRVIKAIMYFEDGTKKIDKSSFQVKDLKALNNQRNLDLQKYGCIRINYHYEEY